MRLALLLAVSALVAGCSGGVQGPAEGTGSTSATATTSTASTSPPTTTPPRVAGAAPRQGAPIGDVVRWIEAGTPADVAGHHSMTRGGETTDLGGDVAFTTAGTETNCVTNRRQDGALACLVKLADPPPRPAGIETAWKPNWVDFAGATVDVGSPHGDPGPFRDGSGAELPAGQSLAFGDYRCRADAAGLFCVDYAHQAAIGLSARGVVPFGCLQKTTPPADIGLRFSC
ncbi:hypothetical protein CIW49_21585 [Mycolicibacterium sp. P1-18]|uniref:hypothetical protein n=1 Tax=Mycolicibacterium sp. P1-18 TaxID=2024615 RepID=UPI0011F10033|nr:hypothetical protein [Mycolicibacterium sp. P1-18]KAA0096113.1 hypothetical protein CIW49_21585 [Mycolicibacterium sp. P1-18]